MARPAAARGRNPGAFRADPAAPLAPRATPLQAAALVAVLALVAGAVTLVSYLVSPARARAFDLLGGSLFLADSVAPVSVDIATGSPSVRLIDATAQVGATPRQSPQLSVVPLYDGGGTLLLDDATGEFNMVDATGFVIKRDGGVPLPSQQPGSWAAGESARDPHVADLTYIEQSGRDRTAVYLVSQATVHEAVTSPTVQPRGSATLAVPAVRSPGGRTTANGDFWMLAGNGPRRRVVQLSLPHKSQADGATLRQRTRATVTGPAALGTATFGADPDSAAAVAVASPGQLEIFSPRGQHHVVTFTPPPGTDRILPVTGQRGRLSFLLHGSGGWSLMSVGASGAGLRGPTPVAGINASAQLVEPAQSGDDLYTMDTSSGQLFRISPDAKAGPVPGAPAYPRATTGTTSRVELRDFPDGYVIARGSRVFYDSPSHRDALAVFTDGDRHPEVIEKSAAVGLNAAGDAAALSRAHQLLSKVKQTTRPVTKHGQPQPTKHTVIPPAVNTTIDCGKITQQPNIPQIYGVQAAARSVTFSWLYPRTSNEDCVPRTYVVTAKLLSAGAPAAPGSVTVSDQQAVTIAGLYPSSTYSFTVTAYLGTLGTTSRAAEVTTTPQGPNAPVDVTARANSSGDWLLSWSSCGTVAPDCVPSGSWQVQPQVCDGKGLIPSLPAITVAADPTTRRQPTAVYPGSSALLGRGLSFRVTGRGIDNLPGTVSAATPCTYSWAPPVPSALSLSASAPPLTSFGTTTSATVTLNLGSDPVRDVGGLGAKVTLALTGGGSTQLKGPFTVDGSSAAVAATFPGVAPGARYTATATVAPAHGGAPVVTTKRGIATRSQWPALSITPTCTPGLLSCTLHLDINGVSSANSNGELFSFNPDNSFIRCNKSLLTFTKPQQFDPGANPVVTTPLSQLNEFYGSCVASVQLIEATSSNEPPVYGGTLSPVATQQVDLGPPDQANLQHDDFSVRWDQQSGAALLSLQSNADIADLTDAASWNETLQSPNNDACGSASTEPVGSANPVSISPPPGCVVADGGLPGPWTVTVSYRNRVADNGPQQFSYQLPGPPPNYTPPPPPPPPCLVSGITATWGPTLAEGVTVDANPPSQLKGCSNWTYELLDASTAPPTQVCPDSTGAAADEQPGSVTIDLSACTTLPADTWQLKASYHSSDGSDNTIGPVAIAGTPPTS